MATRTDQLHSHQFVVQRVIMALALRDPDAPGSPTRRTAGAVFTSLMVAALALAAVGVYAVLRPGDDPSWRDGRSLVIERETGARFVYRDGVLYPVLNHASALLILGSAATGTVLVPRSALADVPRGTPLGIPGAPDPLPAASDLLTGAWSVCSRSTAGDAGTGVESVLSVGGAVPTAPLGDRAVLAQDQFGGLHVLWQGHRYPVESPTVVTIALGWSDKAPARMATALLNAIPAGPPLAPVTLPRGPARSAVAGHRPGEVVVVQSESGARQYAVVLAGGVAEITQVQADLLLADPANKLAGAVPMTPAAYAAAPRATSLVPRGEVVAPARTPELAAPPARGGVCASFVDASGPPVLGLAAATAPAAGEVRVGGAPAAAGGAVVDRVAVPPGHGVVVESVTGTAGAGALALVSDLGIRFPLPSTEALTDLGYAGVQPVRLPSSLVALLPAGRALDPAAARLPAAIA